MAVLYQYILSISCTGTPPIVDIHQHTQECLVLYVIAYAVIVDTEDTTFDAIATITPQTLQAVLLSLSIKLIDNIGDLHYQAPFWVKDGHGDWMSRTTSPLELASQSINIWFLLQEMIDSARTSWHEFIEAELSMSDCKWCPSVLRALSDISSLYSPASDVEQPVLDWLRDRAGNRETPTLNRLVRWDKVVTDLKQNISLDSVNYEILQRIKQYSIFIAHSEDSEFSDEDADTESSVDASP